MVVVTVALVIGSFLGTLVIRLPEGRSIVFGRSQCDGCGKSLGPMQLIPVLSWLFQAGRCSSCGASISTLYLAMELGAAAIALWAFVSVPISIFVPTQVLGWLLFALAIMDWRSMFLSDLLIIPLALLGLVVSWLLSPPALLDHVFGLCGGGMFLYSIGSAYHFLRQRDGLGLGDVKLFGAAGAWLGYSGLPTVLLWATATALLAVFFHRAVGAKITWSSRIAFGSFLCLGTWLVWLYGPLTW
nr:A24 family peptidase [Rhizomicrobium electricum]